ncbi:MAG: carboxypeptidase regulatory-like domain-containing protein [Planctomycetes bacterium]|nr:carboxypeptidase regulatory-like domain-containing protein [Planctomycetota bacterium]
MCGRRPLIAVLALAAAALALATAWVARPRIGPAPAPRESASAAHREAAPAAPESESPGPSEPRAAAETVAPGGWTVAGRVLRVGPEGARPVEGAEVRLLRPSARDRATRHPLPSRETRTGPDGRCEVGEAPPGVSAVIEIDSPGCAVRALGFYKPASGVTPGRVEAGDILLEPAADLIVEVRDPGGEPLLGGRVFVTRTSARQPVHGGTGGLEDSARAAVDRGEGRHVLERAGSGPHRVSAFGPGRVGVVREVDLPLEDPLVVVLAEGRGIAGAVLSTGGQPIENAAVKVWSVPRGLPPDPATTGPDGRFAFDGVPEGPCDIVASADGYVRAGRKDVPGGTEDLVIALEPEAVIEGKVVADVDGAPVADATVACGRPGADPFEARTDPEGRFVLREFPGGSYRVTAGHAAYLPSGETEIEARSGERVEDIVLRLPAGEALEVAVTDAAAGAPIAGATVHLTVDRREAHWSFAHRSAQTSEDGAAVLQGLRAGACSLEVRATGFVSKRRLELEIKEAGQKVAVALEPGSSMSGRVLDPAGAPVAEAIVWANARASPSVPGLAPWEDGSRIAMQVARTGGDGHYRLEGLSPHGAYFLTAIHPRFAAGTVEGIRVQAREDLEGIDIMVRPGGRIQGRVVDARGLPVPEARVDVRDRRAWERWRVGRPVVPFPDPAGASCSTDPEGRYESPRLPAGEYDVQASSKGLLEAKRSGVQVLEGQTTGGVDFTLLKGETLVGRVMEASGAPVAGAEVSLYASGVRDLQTDAEGRFRAEGVRPGGVSGSVRKRGFEKLDLETEVPCAELVLQLERSGRISGAVRVPEGAEIRELHVVAVPVGTEPQAGRDAWADGETGEFTALVAAGTHVVHAIAPGFLPSRSREVSVKSGEAVEGVSIPLERGGEVHGVAVLEGSGEPVEDVSVQVTGVSYEDRGSPWNLPFARTGLDGTFSIGGIPTGRIRLVAMHTRLAQASVPEVAVAPGAVPRVRIELGAGGGVRGRVLRDGAAVVYGASVVPLLAGEAEHIHRRASTDAGGRFEIEGLSPGPGTLRIRVSAWRESSIELEHEVVVAAGQVRDVDVALPSLGRVLGRVTHEGAPVPRAGLSVFTPDEHGRPRFRCELEAGPEGEYSLEAPVGLPCVLEARGPAGQGPRRVSLVAREGETRLDIDLGGPER